MNPITVTVPQNADGSCPEVVVQFVPYVAPVSPPPPPPPPPVSPPPPPVSPPPPPATGDVNIGAMQPGEMFNPPAGA